MPGIKKNYYQISTHGRIKNIKGKLMKYETDKDGYKRCTLTCENGKKKHFFVHRLVAIHFIPNPENKKFVNHLYPEDKGKLYVEYLEWCTHEENIQHSLKHKLQIFRSCEAHGMATLKWDDVERICQLMEKGFTNAEIADEFGKIETVERNRFKGVLKHIRSRKTWKPVSRKYNF